MVKRAICGIGLTALATCTAHAQRAAEAGSVDPTQQDCLGLRRIDRTVVIDDRTILFYMRGDDIYRNVLDRSCPDLGRTKRFSYRVRTSELCRADSITVFDPFGLQLGVTCGLGDFRRITEDEAELLELGPDAAGSDIEITTTDLPVEDTPDSSESADQPREPVAPERPADDAGTGR